MTCLGWSRLPGGSQQPVPFEPPAKAETPWHEGDSHRTEFVHAKHLAQCLAHGAGSPSGSCQH